MLKFQSRARYDACVKILKARRIAAAIALNLKTDRRARNFRIDLFAKLCVINLFAKARVIDLFAKTHVEILSRFGGCKQRDATVRTGGFDGAGR